MPNEWVDIKKELPEKNQAVLITDGKEVASASLDYIRGEVWWDAYGFGGYEWEFNFGKNEVTHWMPIPNPPGK